MSPERLRNIAYRCFLGVAGCVTLVYFGDLLGRGGWLPQPVAAGLLVFVLMPLIFIAIIAALVAMGLTLWVRLDPRLYAISILTLGLMMFWLRLELHQANPAWALTYPLGVALFSTHWLVVERGGKKKAPSARSAPPIRSKD